LPKWGADRRIRAGSFLVTKPNHYRHREVLEQITREPVASASVPRGTTTPAVVTPLRPNPLTASAWLALARLSVITLSS
jgi:hypothetical protein